MSMRHDDSDHGELVSLDRPPDEAPNPRPWVRNNVAGVAFLTRRYPFDALIRFDRPPPPPIVDLLTENGFRWKPISQCYSLRIGYSTAAQDRETARRTYGEVIDLLLASRQQPTLF